MDTKKLRQKILDLAIHGKLVPQDPNDEPASVLLERIRTEKEQLIKEGKIKAPKKSKSAGDTSHYRKDGPWELPEGWVWTTLGSVCSIKGGKRIPKGKTFSKDKTAHVYIRVTDMKNGSVDMADLKYIDEDVYEEIRRYTIEKDDLYLTIAGTIGKVGEIPDALHGMNLTENAARLTEIVCDKRYLMYSLMTDLAQNHFSLRFHQVAQPKLSIETSSSTLIAMPPLAEQKRIVRAIENIFNCFRLLDLNLAALEGDVINAKKLILDLAIHGKLVPQDPADEPASELLRRINPAFKPSDNLHYDDLPQNWAECRLADVCTDFIVPQRDKPKQFDGEIPWCRIEDIEGKYLNGSLSNRLVSQNTIKEMNMRICPIGTVICSCSASIGTQAIVTKPCCTNQTFIGLVCNEQILYNEYLYYFLGSQTEKFLEIGTGTTIKYISREKFEEYIIPLPPVEEQKRIVERIEYYKTLLDIINQSLGT